MMKKKINTEYDINSKLILTPMLNIRDIKVVAGEVVGFTFIDPKMIYSVSAITLDKIRERATVVNELYSRMRYTTKIAKFLSKKLSQKEYRRLRGMKKLTLKEWIKFNNKTIKE